MGFAEEFRELDSERLKRAYANVSEKLLTLSSGGVELANEVAGYFEQIQGSSPGFMAFFESHEEAIEMVQEIPTLSYGEEWFRMIQMTLGATTIGLVLAEYARLESEEE